MESKNVVTEDVCDEQQSLTNAQCCLLIDGYTRPFYEERYMSVPSEIIRVCALFYSLYVDVKIVYCDKNGQFDTTKYQIKSVSIDKMSVAGIAGDIEHEMYRNGIKNEYAKLCQLSANQLMNEPEMSSLFDSETVLKKYEINKEEVIKRIIAKRFGSKLLLSKTNWDQARWCGEYNEQRSHPLVHVWMKFKHMGSIYPIDKCMKAKVSVGAELFENEDKNRWVEVPDDYQNMSLDERNFDSRFDILMIERCDVDNWFDGTGKWPRLKKYEDNWKETLQVGDIIEATDEYGKNYEGFVRYIYPKEHETMSGKCIIHFVGWKTKWDERLDIDSDKIMKRYTNKTGPRRLKSKKGQHIYFYDDDYDAMLSEITLCSKLKKETTKPVPYITKESQPTAVKVASNVTDKAEETVNASNEKQKEQNASAESESNVDFVCKMTADVETYESQKFARNYKAKKMYSKKKSLRKKMRKYGAKSCNKRIENKMKKYKVHYECFAY